MTNNHKRPGLVTWLVAALLALSAVKSFASPDQMKLVLVGSGHKNISAFWLDMASGALTPAGEAAEINAPSFIALSPNQQILYAVTEGRDKDDSFVSAFRVDAAAGKLSLINRQPAGGAGPCHVAVDHEGGNVLLANYGSGSVVAFHIDTTGAVGSLAAFVQDVGSSVNPERQAGPHAHCIVTSPDDRFAFACDLGTDKVMSFKFDESTGALVPNDPPYITVKPGAGPRHIVFHPNGRLAFVINEIASSLTAFGYEPKRGLLSEIEEQPLLPPDFKGQNTAAEVAVHPSGKFVYASNRGDNSIVVFACDPGTGRLTFVERVPSGGKTPRNFEIDPTGAFLLAANQSGEIVVFGIDAKTGHLRPTGHKATMDTPMCVKCLR